MGSSTVRQHESCHLHMQAYKSLESDDERNPNRSSTLCILNSLVIHCGTMANNTDLDTGTSISTREPGGEIGTSILRFSPWLIKTNVK